MHFIGKHIHRVVRPLLIIMCCVFLHSVSIFAASDNASVWLLDSAEPLAKLSGTLQESLQNAKQLNAVESSSIRLAPQTSHWLIIDLFQLPDNKNYVVYLGEPNLTWAKFYLLDESYQATDDQRLASLENLSNVRPDWLIEHSQGHRCALVNFEHDWALTLEVGVVAAKAFEINLHQIILSYGAILGVLILCMFVCAVYFFVSQQPKYLVLNAYFVLVCIGFLIDNGLINYLVNGLDWEAKWPVNEFALCFASYFLYHFLAIYTYKPSFKKAWQAMMVCLLSAAVLSSLLPQFNRQWLFIVSCIGFLSFAAAVFLRLMQRKNSRTHLRCFMLLTIVTQVFSLFIWNGFGIGYHGVHNTILLITSLAICSVLLLKDRQQISAFSYSMLHDADTKLPNKQFLLAQMVKKVSQKQHFSVLLFKPHVLSNARSTFGFEQANICINERLSILNTQLQTMNALKLEIQASRSAWLAHVDDSTFGCLVIGELELSHIEQFACLIHGVFEEGLTHEDINLVDSVDIGVAYYPMHGNTAKQILQCAIQAMTEKRLQGERWRMFDSESARLSEQRLSIAAALKMAIDENQLSLHFQPQICLKTGKVVGCEALLRWHHPVFGAVSPDVFIPIAESAGVINQLTEWVVENGIQWQAKFCKLIPDHVISINISAKDLLNKDLPVLLITILNEQKVRAESVMLELTESATLEESKKIKATLDDYRLIGLKLAIDDFGTGYSSLAYLSQLGFDEVKIDKQFVLNLPFSVNDQSICRATCDIAATLGAQVVAEGIEDEQSLAMLQSYGCEFGQGYYFSKPLCADDYLAWISDVQKVEISLDATANLID